MISDVLDADVPELLGRRIDTGIPGTHRLAALPHARLLLRPVIRPGVLL